MKKTVRIALAGISGYGLSYLHALLPDAEAHNVQLVGVIDPYADRSPVIDEIKNRDIPIYNDLESFFAQDTADLIALATPIQFHAAQTIFSLKQGVNVLCEKPVAATIQEARQMATAEAQAPGFVAIGYQWSFSTAIQALKQDIMTGTLGKPLRLKSRVYWPRTPDYYNRNNWAAHIQADDGTWVLDSPANNATAHYIHNMFYVLGNTRETSAQVASVQAELYRANPIQNYDTVALRAYTTDGIEIHFYASHAVEKNVNPIFDYEFENATVSFVADDNSLIEAQFKDGSHKTYGNPFAENMDKIWQCADAIRNNTSPACGIEAASSQIICINGAQESPERITSFAPNQIRTGDNGLIYVPGLQEQLTTCYDSNILPSEQADITWAVAGRVVDLTGYDEFPRGAIAR